MTTQPNPEPLCAQNPEVVAAVGRLEHFAGFCAREHREAGKLEPGDLRLVLDALANAAAAGEVERLRAALRAARLAIECMPFSNNGLKPVPARRAAIDEIDAALSASNVDEGAGG